MDANRDNLSSSYQEVEFPSEDGLVITGDLYHSPDEKGYILLCHRSHCNRAEYRETAPRLVKLGFSCLAIDQRSGMKIFGETNETSKRAKENGLPTGYLDARIDIEAAIKYCYEQNGKRPILIFGSSYSASLALLCSVDNRMVRSVLAFSPGEYLKNVSVQEAIKGINVPIFVTSSKSESDDTAAVVSLVNQAFLTHHIPTVAGFHGSKMLWKVVPGSEEYWTAIESYLENVVGKST